DVERAGRGIGSRLTLLLFVGVVTLTGVKFLVPVFAALRNGLVEARVKRGLDKLVGDDSAQLLGGEQTGSAQDFGSFSVHLTDLRLLLLAHLLQRSPRVEDFGRARAKS